MSARSIWKGSLVVSLVNIPVKLYKATDEKGKATSCRTLHTKCNTPINQKTICAACNVDVPSNETVSGYPNADGTFTVLTKADIDGIKSPTSDAILGESFVPASDVNDPMWVENSYFLSPDGKAATKGFALIRAGMLKTNTALQALITMEGRERSAVIVPTATGLTLRLMRSKALVRDASELPSAFDPKAVTLSTEELALVNQVIGTMTGPFDPTDYEDGYVTAFHALVESKRTGVALPETALPVAPAAVDLMAALKASLNAGKPALPTKKATMAVAKGKSSAKKAKAS